MRQIDRHPDDTIAAVATPPGRGGVGIVRISGPDALAIGRSLFSFARDPAQIESHRMYPGTVILADDEGSAAPPREGRAPAPGGAVDRGIFVYMRAPRSYTGEDTVELQCHGSPLLLSALVCAAVRHGARAAVRGEFTRRAFMNGKIDLAQAEAVADLIAAVSVDSLSVSSSHLMGALSERIGGIRDRLVSVLAEVEAAVDFSDQDIEAAPADGIGTELESIRSSVEALIATYRTGRVLREGLVVVIVGPPNVGKSSLMNALVGRPRAIVDETPGTTTDTVEEATEIGGFAATVVDTCGLGDPGRAVEREGVRRAREATAGADVVLVVGEAPAGIGAEERRLVEGHPTGDPRRSILVMNKADLLPPGVEGPVPADLSVRVVFTSALLGTGIAELKEAIAELILGGASARDDEVLVTNARHYGALLSAAESLAAAIGGLWAGLGPELVAVDLSGALSALGEVTGEVTTDRILEEIFSRFCIGK
jgi:tRNA modification GTPase